MHVRYNEFKAVLSIPDGEVLEGELPIIGDAVGLVSG
ncbi:DUF4160 domain-containing protein [Denitratisoma oestradiolicum]|nr:DUF4160 domain-containing protein [Denitratisoma oestradiolicum]TWO80949.1 hypothetical protein CBW56_07300 [Denitratisoma oestradiolicum]